MKYLLACLSLCIALLSPSLRAEIAPTGSATPTLAPMLQRIMPAVVNIAAIGDYQKTASTAQKIPPNQTSPSGKHKFESLGSGVIIDASKGYIVTNNHVIKDAKTIMVTAKDGRRFDATVIGKDPASDIAVIQIKAKHLTQITLGNSNALSVGDFVATIGSPFGLNQTVTSGIVSALSRSGLGIEGYEDFIQTDAPINPGNSGGALVNLKGELVGINTAILAPDGANVGIGFAIPASMFKPIVEQLIKYHQVHRGLMGVLVQNLTPALANAFNTPQVQGGLVTQVNPYTPANEAGIQVGDIITAVNGHPMKTATEVRNTVGLLGSKHKVKLTLIRDGKEKHITTRLLSPEELAKASKKHQTLLSGVALANFTHVVPQRGYVQGVGVIRVNPDSPAYRAGLREGDVILTANRQAATNISVLMSKVKNIPEGGHLLLNVLHGTGAMFLVIK